ncbi:hypothetical protein LWI29_007533 [Acer saccharum]|uniref:Uncharacterized protein n=1 Tax=Acer saccharum TaxID=4024 RepID=A0AA39W4Y8_ACESA|nr:hypothetical protein LWI29_007533 [Acer saccharum]
MRQVEGGSQTRETSGIHTEPFKGVLVDRRDSERVMCVASEGMREVVLHVHGAKPKYSNVDSGDLDGTPVSWKNRETAGKDIVCPIVGEASGLEGHARVDSVGGKGNSSSQPLQEEFVCDGESMEWDGKQYEIWMVFIEKIEEEERAFE